MFPSYRNQSITNQLTGFYMMGALVNKGLSDTAKIFFHFIQAFGNKVKLRNFVNIWKV